MTAAPNELFLTSSESVQLLPVRRCTRVKSLSNGFRDDLVLFKIDIGLEIMPTKRNGFSQSWRTHEVVLASRTGSSLNSAVSHWPVGVYVIVPKSPASVEYDFFSPDQYVDYARADAFPSLASATGAFLTFSKHNF